jgi:ABC-type oligopeptide transport system substrate-binding subunit
MAGSSHYLNGKCQATPYPAGISRLQNILQGIPLKTQHNNNHTYYRPSGRAMVEVVSRRPLTADARVRARLSLCTDVRWTKAAKLLNTIKSSRATSRFKTELQSNVSEALSASIFRLLHIHYFSKLLAGAYNSR